MFTMSRQRDIIIVNYFFERLNVMIYKKQEEILGNPSDYVDGSKDKELERIVKLIADILDMEASALYPYFYQHGLTGIIKNPTLIESLHDKDINKLSNLFELLKFINE